MGLLGEAQLREQIERLARIERGSASPGEAEAARLIADELRGCGARARLEEESAHGGYWWPIGLLTGAAALLGASRSRLGAALGAALAAAAVTDDITGGSQWYRRRLLPARTTTNVIAELGPPDASQTLIVVGHHDAAHSGIVFHPELPRAVMRRFPKLAEGAETTPGTMWPAVGGPLLVAVGSILGSHALRRAGALVCAGFAAAMADIGARGTVPGANDNLSGVAVLLSLAHEFGADPPPDTRLILLSTGSEESFMEGMQAFARRHFPDLPRESTRFICVDTVGSPHLLVLEGEGMVWMNEYPKDFIALAKECARDLGIDLVPNLRLRNATDGLIPLRAGYPTITIGSVDEFKIPTHYHWPSDVPENLRLGTVADCARLVREVILRASRRA